MNTNINATIRRLTNTFIILLLLISLVAAYVQISDQAFFNGPALAHGQYNANGQCPPYNAPIRGTIYDRNGVKLAWSEPDINSTCGYKRVYADPSLSPLIGYFSYQYGTAGIEATYNDWLSGTQHGETFPDVVSKLLHRPRYGNDLYLTIDERLQQYADHVFDLQFPNGPAYVGYPCETSGTSANGSMIIENPNNGEILAMVSHPYFDPNQIDNPAYWQQINSDPNLPLLNRATQGLYVPGSTFKTLTLGAALNEGAVSLNTQFDKNTAVYYTTPDGDVINWDDYINGVWPNLNFPLTLQAGYAFSDNSLYAREAVNLGANKWLGYVRDFGIETPGANMPVVQSIPFDAPQSQSTAFNATTNGQATQFNDNLLGESGFGQGGLLITPLTMEELTSAVAADGTIYQPHVGWKQVPHGTGSTSILPLAAVVYGQPFRAETAQAVRKAMWAVTSYGTADTLQPYNGKTLAQTGTFEGGKTGTGQTNNANPQTWWISLAPDDQAPGAPGGAKYAITLMKEHSGEGACQVFVSDSVYQYAMNNHIGY